MKCLVVIKHTILKMDAIATFHINRTAFPCLVSAKYAIADSNFIVITISDVYAGSLPGEGGDLRRKIEWKNPLSATPAKEYRKAVYHQRVGRSIYSAQCNYMVHADRGSAA